MTGAERQARVDLAAAYQLTDPYGWSDLSSTHISARVPPEAVQRRTIDQGLGILGPQGHARTGSEWPSIVRELERARRTGYRT